MRVSPKQPAWSLIECSTRCRTPRGGGCSMSSPSATDKPCSSCTFGSSPGSSRASPGKGFRGIFRCWRRRACCAPNGAGEASTTFSSARRCAMRGRSGLDLSPTKKMQLETMRMKIVLTSVLVDDQEKALRFYRDVLGFQLKHDIPLGAHRWLTVVSPEQPDGVELVLEPDEHPAAKPFKSALIADGIPCTSFGVDDVKKEHE